MAMGRPKATLVLDSELCEPSTPVAGSCQAQRPNRQQPYEDRYLGRLSEARSRKACQSKTGSRERSKIVILDFVFVAAEILYLAE